MAWISAVQCIALMESAAQNCALKTKDLPDDVQKVIAVNSISQFFTTVFVL